MAEVCNSLTMLFPPFGELVSKLTPKLNELDLYVFETYRSLDRQLERYSCGRVLKNNLWVVTDKTKVVTNAMPGQGFHTYGLAMDAVPDGDQSKAGIQWSWADTYLDAKLVKHQVPWQEYGKLVTAAGCTWLGAPGSRFPEMPHIQKTYGVRTADLYAILVKDGLEAVWKYLYKKIPAKVNQVVAPVTITPAHAAAEVKTIQTPPAALTPTVLSAKAATVNTQSFITASISKVLNFFQGV